MAQRPDLIGQQFGNYRLTRLLGSGGFAEVYLGQHLYLKSQAAIKLLHARLAEREMTQFQREGQTLANLDHPAIVRVLDFGLADHSPYLVMSYAPGGTLRNRHQYGTRVALAEVAEYVRQIGPALQYAHDHKMVHCDVKPENILIGRHGEFLLGDFGLALITQSFSLQNPKRIMGTAGYMSPEQIQGHPRPSSDQYALAIAIYEWLCGKRPFHGPFMQMCAQHLFAPPPPFTECGVSTDPMVEGVVMTALAKKPEERFSSIQAFVTAFLQASQQTSTLPNVQLESIITSSQLELDTPKQQLPASDDPVTPYQTTQLLAPSPPSSHETRPMISSPPSSHEAQPMISSPSSSHEAQPMISSPPSSYEAQPMISSPSSPSHSQEKAPTTSDTAKVPPAPTSKLHRSYIFLTLVLVLLLLLFSVLRARDWITTTDTQLANKNAKSTSTAGILINTALAEKK